MISRAPTGSEDPEEEGESLMEVMEVLENIKEGSQELAMLSKKSSPLLTPKSFDPDRITDYPRAQSPPESHSPMEGSRRSSVSLSAMSESSFTSDNSSVVSYDANKMPKKKILKNPHRKQKHSTNRVRWKDEEGDTVSMRSFDSLSTTSEIYTRARNGMKETRRHWREFERSPVHGGVGLTPSGARGLRNHRHRPYVGGAPQHSHSSSSLLSPSSTPSPSISPSHYLLGGSPGVHANAHRRSVSTSSLPANRELSNFANNHSSVPKAFQRSLSPLTSSAISSSSDISPRRNLQSTPKAHHQSDSVLLTTTKRGTDDSRELFNASPNRSFDIDLPYPVLRLDNSNLTDLEESTMEDRKKMHIFKFPQDTPTAKSPLFSGGQRVTKMTPVFLDDDDEGDYDHLSPKDETETKDKERNGESSTDKPEGKDQVGSRRKNDRNINEDLYSDKDIEDALGELEDGSVKSSSSSTEEPPPVPSRDRATKERKEEVGNEADISLSMIEDVEQLEWQVSQASLSLSGSQEAQARPLTGGTNPQRTAAISSKEVVTGPKVPDKPARSETVRNTSSQGIAAKEKDVTSSSNHTISAPRNDLAPVESGTAVPAEPTDSSVKPGDNQQLRNKPKPPPIAPKPIRVQGLGRTGGVLIGSNATASPPSPQSPGALSTKSSVNGTGKQTSEDSQDQTPSFTPPSQDQTSPPSHQDAKGLPPSGEKIAPPDQAEITPPQQVTPPNQEETAPPPLPPKTKRIRRQDRDISGQPLPPMLDTSSSQPNGSHPITPADDAVEDILPPPPEFAFPSSPDFSDPSTDPASHDILESASNSTLVPDHEDIPEARQILELDQFYERDACSSSSSSSSLSHRSNKHSWSVIHHNKAKERTASRASGSVSPTGSSVGSSLEDLEGGGHGRGVAATSHTSWSRLQGTEHSSNLAGINGVTTSMSTRTSNSSIGFVTRHKKTSMETSVPEGGVSKINTHHSSHRKYPHDRHHNDRGPHHEPLTNGSGNLDVHLGPTSGQTDPHAKHRHYQHVPHDLQLRRVPNRHAPPPPVNPNLTAKLSGEERQMLHLVYTDKPRMMKPVVHDTEKHIKEMLAEIDSDNSRRQTNPTSYGTSFHSVD